MPTDKPWFLKFFEMDDGHIRLLRHPTQDWLKIAENLLDGTENLAYIGGERHVSLETAQACLALYAWCLQNPIADPLSLFAPPEPEGAAEPSEFAKAVAAKLADWRDDVDLVIEDIDEARTSLSSAFVDAYKKPTFNHLRFLAATCQQIAEDLELTPNP